jgi:hypothetical protein
MAFVLLAAAGVGAQTLPGDWVVSGGTGYPLTSGGLYSIRPGTGVVTTILPEPAPNTTGFDAVRMAANNEDLLAAHVQASLPGSQSSLVTVTTAGVMVTIATIAAPPNPSTLEGLDRDQDGATICAVNSMTMLGGLPPLRHVTDSGLVTTVWTGLSFNQLAQDLRIDPETGDWLIPVVDDLIRRSFLIRVNRLTQTGTVAFSRAYLGGVGRISSVDVDPRTGEYLVGFYDEALLLRVTRQGVATTLTNALTSGAWSVRMDAETGQILAGVADGNVFRMDSGGQMLEVQTVSPRAARSVELYGSREVVGAGPAQPGTTYAVYFRFPRSPGRPYVAALSLGLRPGVGLSDGRTIHLDVTSPLFYLTLGGFPGVVTGFAGTLDGTGRASGSVLILPGLPVGTRLFATAIALNPALSLGLDLALTWGFSVN